LIYDTDQSGLETVFEPWQIAAIKEVYNVRDRADAYVGSREVYESLLKSSTPISRASVINFLAEMAAQGLLKVKDSTGKGGHRSLYTWNIPEAVFSREIGLRVIRSVRTQLGVNIEHEQKR
jgi:hypothetical protein